MRHHSDSAVHDDTEGGGQVPAPTPPPRERESPNDVLTIPEVLGSNVRAFRLLRRLEQEDVADRMRSLGHKWRRATVSEVERVRRNVTVPELLALVAVLGANVVRLLDPRGPGGGRTGPQVALPAQSWGHATGEDVEEHIDLDPDEVRELISGEDALFHWSFGRLQGIELPERDHGASS